MLILMRFWRGRRRPKRRRSTPPGGRYSLTLQTKPDRIRLALCDGGKEIFYAWSKLRGSSELDLAQAISYAAHLIYKFSEQRTLGTEDK